MSTERNIYIYRDIYIFLQKFLVTFYDKMLVYTCIGINGPTNINIILKLTIYRKSIYLIYFT